MDSHAIKVGLVGPLPPPSGGMANQTRQLARLLGEEGVEVELVQVNAPYWPAWIAAVRGIRALFRLVPYLTRLWLTAKRVQLFHVMANSGWAWHLFAVPVVWVARWRRVPVIINYRGGEADSFFEREFRWVKPTLARVQSIVVPSGFLQHVFDKRGVDVQIVPNIIDLSRFFPASRERDEKHIIVARNLEDIYDIPTALRAFAKVRQRIPHARLTVAGSGPRLADLRELCDSLGIASAVHFTGRLDNERMADLYRQADLMLNSSLADNMPISLLEAMASGVPVVSTDVGGVPYLVKHGKDALLVPPGDPAAMADAAVRILEDRELARRLIQSGIESARQFTWNEVRPRLFAVYANVLGVSAPRAWVS